MPRIKLDEQPSYKFHYPITLEPRDINYGGHMGNDAIISLVGAARARMFHSMGLTEGDLGDGRTGIIMSDLVVNFKAEGFMFDAMIIDTNVGEFSRTGFRIFHRVKRGETIIVLMETGVIAFDYGKGRIAPVPPEFLKRVESSGSE
jgi:acyl-CoA thioester hydrolase